MKLLFFKQITLIFFFTLFSFLYFNFAKASVLSDFELHEGYLVGQSICDSGNGWYNSTGVCRDYATTSASQVYSMSQSLQFNGNVSNGYYKTFASSTASTTVCASVIITETPLITTSLVDLYIIFDGTTSFGIKDYRSGDFYWQLENGSSDYNTGIPITLNEYHKLCVTANPATETVNYKIDDNEWNRNVTGSYSFVDRFYMQSRQKLQYWDFITNDVDEETPDGVAGYELTWFFPQNGNIVNNDDWSDWGLYYDLDSSDMYNYLMLKITSYDFMGNYYVDTDFITSTTDLTYWTTERSAEYDDGDVFANAEIFGTNLEGCSSYLDDTCIWYSVAYSPDLAFIASSTGGNVFDFGTSGVFPASSTGYANTQLSKYFDASSTEKSDILSRMLDDSISPLKYIFPFGQGLLIYEQWRNSEGQSLPDNINFLDMIDSEGNMYIPVPNFSGSTTQFKIWSQDFFTENEAMAAFFVRTRAMSTKLFYIIFILALIYGSYTIYQEVKSD